MKSVPRGQLIVRESMRLSFRGGEWWAVELDALYTHTELAQEKFLRDIARAKRPSMPSAVAVHLRDTLITPDFAAVIAAELSAAGDPIRKAALIGVGRGTRLLLRRKLAECRARCAVQFFGDYEKAKEWLIP